MNPGKEEHQVVVLGYGAGEGMKKVFLEGIELEGRV